MELRVKLVNSNMSIGNSSMNFTEVRQPVVGADADSSAVNPPVTFTISGTVLEGLDGIRPGQEFVLSIEPVKE